jgi:hypothetical protein
MEGGGAASLLHLHSPCLLVQVATFSTEASVCGGENSSSASVLLTVTATPPFEAIWNFTVLTLLGG